MNFDNPTPSARQADELAETAVGVKVARGRGLFHQNDLFKGLYGVKAGLFKTVATTPDGRELITGFLMPGDLIGLDGIANWRYASSAIALEDSWVSPLEFSQPGPGASRASLHEDLPVLMAREIVREQSIILMLATMRAEEKVAAFLVDYMQRLEARGLATREIQLPMSRQDLGNYLGLTLETVSRTLSALSARRLIQVSGRHVAILDRHGLEHCAGSEWPDLRRPSPASGAGADPRAGLARRQEIRHG